MCNMHWICLSCHVLFCSNSGERLEENTKSLKMFIEMQFWLTSFKCCKKLRAGHGKLQDDPRSGKKALTWNVETNAKTC
jgi:hypothetical protein